ncbi:hypothetical protein [Streptomyces sp. NRRL F-5065]|uniref:hypothetical protein n=1 Tax=Streptomyces sp. NRRL F-5065 TaxID=1463855 RepID=UPI000B0EEEB7|nr:hypothetical protein [Streptomyces sp. NRRL F-5065]
MGWKDAFGDAMKELEAIRQQLTRLDRLDDPTVGLTALHGDVTQSRLKILEQIQAGVTGLREENREVRRRQDRMISDLNETRGELRQLLDLMDVLRPLVPPEGTDDTSSEGTQTHPEGAAQPPEPEAGYGSSASAEGHPSISTDTDSQGGTMENTGHRPQPESGEDQDLALKRAIEAAYKGTGTPAGQPSAATPQTSAGAVDPQVAHGVLLLKAAGVASAELIAHRDTWEWLAALAVDHSHFRTPPSVEDIKEGRVQTVLSGRSLIALLIELWNTRSTATPLQADYALAMTTYDRIAVELTDLTGQGETIRIILDDGLPQDSGD